jgi:hypothetical protein
MESIDERFTWWTSLSVDGQGIGMLVRLGLI